jgi:hypothetical protein
MDAPILLVVDEDQAVLEALSGDLGRRGPPGCPARDLRGAMTTATLTIVVIAVLIVGAIAWNVFGGKGDLDRRRPRGQDPSAPE